MPRARARRSAPPRLRAHKPSCMHVAARYPMSVRERALEGELGRGWGIGASSFIPLMAPIMFRAPHHCQVTGGYTPLWAALATSRAARKGPIDPLRHVLLLGISHLPSRLGPPEWYAASHNHRITLHRALAPSSRLRPSRAAHPLAPVLLARSQEKCIRVCAGSKLIMPAVHPERPATSSAAAQPDAFSWPNAESRRSPVLARRRTARDSLNARRRARALQPPALRELSHRARLYDRTLSFFASVSLVGDVIQSVVLVSACAVW